MEKSVTLKNGKEIVIREMDAEDADRSFAFFCRLSEDDRKYLRADVTKWEVVSRRYQDHKDRSVLRLIAVDGDDIVADGALQLKWHGWGENIAEIRLIVASSHQRVGLGSLLARQLYYLAAESKVDRIVARLMRPQIGAKRIMRRLGFQDEFLIPEHIRDREGKWQDMIIMRCNLEDLWREMEGVLGDSDWQSHR